MLAARTGRRAPCPRQHVLGRDHDPAAGDGLREAHGRHAHGGDRAGYHLDDGVNCRLVAPGDLAALEHAVVGVLDDRGLAAGLGLRARETVERYLTWPMYANEIRRLLVDAADRTTVSA